MKFCLPCLLSALLFVLASPATSAEGVRGGTTELEDASETSQSNRMLGDTYAMSGYESCKYIYWKGQKETYKCGPFKWFTCTKVVFYESGKQYDKPWCVEVRNAKKSDGFPTTIGAAEIVMLGDDDLIALTNDCNQNTCDKRADIGTCSFDSYYDNYDSIAPVKRLYELHMCTPP